MLSMSNGETKIDSWLDLGLFALVLQDQLKGFFISFLDNHPVAASHFITFYSPS